jgi:hypothetical protein
MRKMLHIGWEHIFKEQSIRFRIKYMAILRKTQGMARKMHY